MKSDYCDNAYELYPEYKPSNESEIFITTPGTPHAIPVSIKGSPDFFEIMAELPGVRVEDLVIHIYDKDVVIVVLHKGTGHPDGGPTGAARRKCFERRIGMPPSADTSRATASFDNNLLKITIAKSHDIYLTHGEQVLLH